MSTDEPPGLPQWVTEIKREALLSEEWVQLSKTVESRVQEKLAKRGLQVWSQLSDAEKEIFVDEVEEDICHERTYQRFYRRLGGSLDRTLLKLEDTEWRFTRATRGEVVPRGFEEQAEEKHRFPDIVKVLEIAGEGAGALLRRWPDRLNELKVVGCRGLPPGLRREVWRLQLEHAEARMEYEKMVNEHRLGVISKLDVQITKSCRQLIDAEFEQYRDDLSDHLMNIKSILSYIQVKFDGLVESPLQYIAVVLVWGLNGSTPQPLTLPLLIERMFALLEDVGYDKSFDFQQFNILPGGVWPALVAKVSEAVVTADRDFHDFLLHLDPAAGEDDVVDGQQLRVSGFEHRLDDWHKSGKDTRPKQRRMKAEHGVLHRVPWNLRSKQEDSASRGLFGLLIKPLVQRLFAGFFDELEGTCRVWDGLLLLGAEWLPHFCAAFLLALKPHIMDLLPRESSVNKLAWAHLEWALNASCGVLSALAFERTLDAHFMPKIRKDLRIRETREAMLSASLPTGDGSRPFLTPASQTALAASKEEDEDEGKRPSVETAAAGCQTDSSVTADRDVARLLSPRLRDATAPPPDDSPSLEAAPSELEPADARPVQRAAVDDGVIDTVQLWYASRIYSLKVPRFDARMVQLSGLADMVLNVPDNEDLLAAAIQHERRIPCTVARLQGKQLRLAKPSNVDVPLMMALVQKFLEIENDYTRPMLRIDIAEQERGQLAELYLPALAKGNVHATGVVETAAKRAGLELSQEQIIEFARQLEEYSRLPPREELKRVDPRADPTKFRDPSYQSTEKIGFDLRIDLPLGQIAVAVRRADITFTVRQSDAEDLAKEVLRRTRMELAEVLNVPQETLEAIGIHAMPAHTMAEFNLSSPFAATQNRTVLQIFDELTNLIANPYSDLHQRTCLKKTVRAILRGKPHVAHVRALRKALTPPVHEAATGLHPSAVLAEQREAEERQLEEEERRGVAAAEEKGAPASTVSVHDDAEVETLEAQTAEESGVASRPGQRCCSLLLALAMLSCKGWTEPLFALYVRFKRSAEAIQDPPSFVERGAGRQMHVGRRGGPEGATGSQGQNSGAQDERGEGRAGHRNVR